MKVTWKMEWLSKSIGGSKVSRWLGPHPSIAGRAICSVCPTTFHKGFSYGEGWASITQHAKAGSHVDNLKQSLTDPEWVKPKGNMMIKEGIQKMKERGEVKQHSREELLQMETRWCFSMTNHGGSGRLVACGSKMIPALFGRDCAGARNWSMGRTKFTYNLLHGLAPYFKGKVVEGMKKRHFSLNFDESEVNGDSLIDLNASYVNEDLLVEKRMFSAVPIEVLNQKCKQMISSDYFLSGGEHGQ